MTVDDIDPTSLRASPTGTGSDERLAVLHHLARVPLGASALELAEVIAPLSPADPYPLASVTQVLRALADSGRVARERVADAGPGQPAYWRWYSPQARAAHAERLRYRGLRP